MGYNLNRISKYSIVKSFESFNDAYLRNGPFGLMNSVFTNGPGDQGSIPGR